MAEDVLGGRARAPELSHAMQLLRDDLLVEVEEMGAAPRLPPGETEHLLERGSRDGSAAKSRHHRMLLGRRRRVAERETHVVRELPAHADGEALLHHDDVLR